MEGSQAASEIYFGDGKAVRVTGSPSSVAGALWPAHERLARAHTLGVKLELATGGEVFVNSGQALYVTDAQSGEAAAEGAA